MNLSVSNIGWTAENDVKVYEILKELGFNGVEIAPTRIIPESPYDNCDKARAWAKEIKDNYGFVVPSMQSIWYGRQEALFGSAEERKALVEYTKKAIDFAEAISEGPFNAARNGDTLIPSALRKSHSTGLPAHAYHTRVGAGTSGEKTFTTEDVITSACPLKTFPSSPETANPWITVPTGGSADPVKVSSRA